MNIIPELEIALDSLLIETSVKYYGAQEIPTNSDSESASTHIQGMLINEGALPDFGLAVLCSQKFSCLQPGNRHYAEPSDFTMEPGIKWQLFQEGELRDVQGNVLHESRIIDSRTLLGILDPMVAVD